MKKVSISTDGIFFYEKAGFETGWATMTLRQKTR